MRRNIKTCLKYINMYNIVIYDNYRVFVAFLLYPYVYLSILRRDYDIILILKREHVTHTEVRNMYISECVRAPE